MRKPGRIDDPHLVQEVHRAVSVSPLPQISGGPTVIVHRDPPSASISLDQGSRLQLEDTIQQIIDGWSDDEKATAYWYLFASGMNLEKAKSIRRRAGFIT